MKKKIVALLIVVTTALSITGFFMLVEMKMK